ncbi:T9SS type A sorting domain-containing protein [Chryseobacterium scophthalmum]|uniref:T9SS type A sorting domain-containing protein n=1 Tax=Chryseobacterium scophthalmum TaxID=59733 RepID=UPI001AEC50F9|nr:T9SS type A sorting domain-containing protein [Chryseobacterium scophthalmum]
MGVAFHLDKDNTIAETNENDNIKLLGAGYHSKMANIGDKIEVNVYNMNGNLLKKLKTTSDDTDFMNIKSQLGSGKYILRTNEKSRQVLIK